MTSREDLLRTKTLLEAFLRELEARRTKGVISQQQYEDAVQRRFGGNDPRRILARIDERIRNEGHKGAQPKPQTIVVQLSVVAVLALVTLFALFNTVHSPTGFVSLEPTTGTKTIDQNVTSTSTFSLPLEDVIRVTITGTLHGAAEAWLIPSDETAERIRVMNVTSDEPLSIKDLCDATCDTLPIDTTAIEISVPDGWFFVDYVEYMREGVHQSTSIPDIEVYERYELDLADYFGNAIAYGLDTSIPYRENGSRFILEPNETGTFSATSIAIGIDDSKYQVFTITVEQANEIRPVLIAAAPSITQTFEQGEANIGNPVFWRSIVTIPPGTEQPIAYIHKDAINITVRKQDTGEDLSLATVFNETNITVFAYNQREAVQLIDEEIAALAAAMRGLPREEARELGDRIESLEREKQELLIGGGSRITGNVVLTESNGLLSRLLSWLLRAITGNVVGTDEVTVSLPKQEYAPGEPVVFTLVPEDATASIYVQGPTVGLYIPERRFEGQETGEYTAIALITSGTRVSRFTIPFRITENPTETGGINVTATPDAAVEEEPIEENAVVEEPTEGTADTNRMTALVLPLYPAVEITYATLGPSVLVEWPEITIISPHPYKNAHITVELDTDIPEARMKDAAGKDVPIEAETAETTRVSWIQDIEPYQEFHFSSNAIIANTISPQTGTEWTIPLQLRGSGVLAFLPYPEDARIKSVACGNEAVDMAENNLIEDFTCDKEVHLTLNVSESTSLGIAFGDATKVVYSGTPEEATQAAIARTIPFVMATRNPDVGSLYDLAEANEHLGNQELRRYLEEHRETVTGIYQPFRKAIYGETISAENVPDNSSIGGNTARLLKILLCNDQPLNNADFEEFMRVSTLPEVTYDSLHGLLALLWMQKFGCWDTESIDKAITASRNTLADLDAGTHDLYAEQMAFLSESGISMSEEHLVRLLETQNINGGFGNDQIPDGHIHTTALALWALSNP